MARPYGPADYTADICYDPREACYTVPSFLSPISGRPYGPADYTADICYDPQEACFQVSASTLQCSTALPGRCSEVRIASVSLDGEQGKECLEQPVDCPSTSIYLSPEQAFGSPNTNTHFWKSVQNDIIKSPGTALDDAPLRTQPLLLLAATRDSMSVYAGPESTKQCLLCTNALY